jgi:hypothetical protein
MAAIFRASRGIPRIINLICEQALILAYVKQLHQVPAALVQTVVRDLDLEPQPFMVSSAPSGPGANPPPSMSQSLHGEGGEIR